MTYDDFKTHLSVFLWKDNDATLIASLDNLITMGTASLEQLLKIEDRVKLAAFPITANEMPLPADFRSIRSVTSTETSTVGEFYYTTPAKLITTRSLVGATNVVNAYSLLGPSILFAGPFSVGTPFNTILAYYGTLPDYRGTNTSFLAEKYLDLYTYAVLKQTAPFLREDERVTLWQNMFKEALETALFEDKHERQLGTTAPHTAQPSRTTRGQRVYR
ncbi:hypothetical protein [Tropicibacter sp. Alg240-R139]|uniref:phage adaptor protein n=1 Tax=Tropicibacter sp. Alg240-R139 TaxID=2305991 RepID=UPI0013DFC056|nr:hypothetical protein [Tropicibacter sp. Alg240-R139]